MEQSQDTPQFTPEDIKTMNQFLALAKAVRANGSANFFQNRPIQGNIKPINLVELFWYIMERLKIVVIAAIIGALLGGFYGLHAANPIYSATAKLYLLGQGTAIQVSNLQLGSYMAIDYQEIFKTWELHEMVRSALDLPYSYTEMQSMVSVSSPNNSRVLYITAKNSDPQLAADIANEYANSSKDFVLRAMDVLEPSTFSTALVPGVASVQSRVNYIPMGFLAGIAASVAAIFGIYMLDNRPRSTEEIERVSGLPTLAVLPEITAVTRQNIKKAQKRGQHK